MEEVRGGIKEQGEMLKRELELIKRELEEQEEKWRIEREKLETGIGARKEDCKDRRRMVG